MCKRIVLFLILIFFLIRCSNEKKTEFKSFTIKDNNFFKQVSFEKLSEQRVPDISFPCLYLDKGVIGVYGLDVEGERYWSIKRFNLDLKLIDEHKLNFGQGPGDIGTGGVFYSNGMNLYFHDNSLRRVSIFSRDLVFKKMVKTSAFYPITFIEKGKYFLATENNYRYGKKSFYDFNIISFPDFKKKLFYQLGPFWPFDEKMRLIVGSLPGFHYFYHNKNIFFLNMKKYEIIVFDLEGEILLKAKLKLNVERLDDITKDKWLRAYLGNNYSKKRFTMDDKKQFASWMIPLEKGFVIVRRNYKDFNCMKGILKGDYFDYELNFKGVVKFPCFYKNFTLTSGYFPNSIFFQEGYLYLLNEVNEDYYIEKWKVAE